MKNLKHTNNKKTKGKKEILTIMKIITFRRIEKKNLFFQDF